MNCAVSDKNTVLMAFPDASGSQQPFGLGTRAFIFSFSKYLLSIYNMPGKYACYKS